MMVVDDDGSGFRVDCGVLTAIVPIFWFVILKVSRKQKTPLRKGEEWVTRNTEA